jgi:hypothetical protein
MEEGMRLNMPKRCPVPRTHEGAPAIMHLTPEQHLRRSVMSCMLFEDTFYEDGVDIAERIAQHAAGVTPSVLANTALEARMVHHLRHVPLILLSTLARTGRGSSIVSAAIERTISRADELTEFLAVYAKMNGVTPDKVKPKLSAQTKKGLAKAFRKFDEYQLAKYDRAGVVKLRDVLFLSHAKPKNAEQAEVWKRLVAGELKTPDTWEVKLSSGKERKTEEDKREVWEGMLASGKLGYMALLRNLRNMVEAGVSKTLIEKAIINRVGANKVLPFRYVAAAKACPQLEPAIDEALCAAIKELPQLPGRTVVLVDVSASMDGPLSKKSDMTRMVAAATLASILNCEDLRVFSFSGECVEVPPRRGLAGVDAIMNSQHWNGTHLFGAIDVINKNVPYDRIIVITDEQSHQRTDWKGRELGIPNPIGKQAYVINTAPYQNGVGYGPWVHIDGFSEAVIRFIYEYEDFLREFCNA